MARKVALEDTDDESACTTWPPPPVQLPPGDSGTGWRIPGTGARALLSELESFSSPTTPTRRAQHAVPTIRTQRTPAPVPKTPTSPAYPNVTTGPLLPLTVLRGTPGGASRRPNPELPQVEANDGKLKLVRGRGFTHEAINEWLAQRRSAGKQTFLLDITLARIRHNDSLVHGHRVNVRDRGGFHIDYERKGELRKELTKSAEIDMVRIARPYDWQTDSLTFVFSARPETRPDNLEPNSQHNPASMVVTDWTQLRFGFEVIPDAFKERGEIHPQYRAAVQELRNMILRTFVKPHVETWALRRNISGQPGQLAGERRPFTKKSSNPTLAERYDSAFLRAHALALPQVGRPRLPEHVSSITATLEIEQAVINLLVKKSGPEALAWLEKQGFDTATAAYAVYVAALDRGEGFDMDAMCRF